MKLRDALDQDRTLITAWSTSPSAEMAGGFASCPFDAVTVDMQHGAHSEDTAFASVRAIAVAGSLRCCASRWDAMISPAGRSTWGSRR